MRIGLVRRGYSATGGAEAYLTRLAQELLCRGDSVVLFSDVEWPESWPGKNSKPVSKHFHLRTPESEPTIEVDITKTMLFWGVAAPASPRLFAEQMRRNFKESPCDFLLSLERILECDAYRAGDGVHAAWLDRRAAFEAVWRRWFRRLNSKHREILELERTMFTGGARIVIANSQLVKREIMERFGTPGERIHVVYNGLPTWQDEPGLREKTRKELGLQDSEYVVLFAGSGWERKGLEYAISAVNSAPAATLLIAGKGRRRGMPDLARGRYLGAQTTAQMRALLMAADAFILPTIYDPFSNACLEAMAAGLPVITTTANGFAEIIEPDVEGTVVEPGDVPALAAAVIAWADARKRSAVRERLQTKGRRYSIEANVDQTLQILTATPREQAG